MESPGNRAFSGPGTRPMRWTGHWAWRRFSAHVPIAISSEFVMAGPVIAVTDSVFPSLDPAKAALAKLNPTFLMSKSANADDILAVAKDADAILVTYAKLTREILTQLTNCKAIGRFGLGVDNIDLPTAKEKGIAVNYVPDYCIREVSDHAMALLLALIRKIPLSNKLVQSGRWEMPD